MPKPFALIIEDDRDIVALFRHVLDIAGYQTEIVLDGREAMSRLLSVRPDIVLLDLQLPGLSGIEIFQKMRSIENLKDVPVVIVTAYAFASDGLPEEPDLVLSKPVDINQLSSLVQRLRKTHGELQEQTVDETTGLYSPHFFMVRLTFSMERIRQSQFRRFGVLFADLLNYDSYQGEMKKQDLKTFLRKMAEKFRGTLRPTDTMAWSGDGTFLTLIEDLPATAVTQKIAERVRDGFGKHSAGDITDESVLVGVGVLVCDPDYTDVDAVFADLQLMRQLIKKQGDPTPLILDRDKLETLRTS